MQPASIDYAIDQAFQHQANGRLQEAEALYRQVLAAQPRHPEANHNLGVLLLEMNRMQEAVGYLKAALEADPADGQVWVSYIDALIHAGLYPDAREVLAAGRRRGLAGGAVDSLQRRLDVLEPKGSPAAARPVQSSAPVEAGSAATRPSPDEQARLAALRAQGRHADAEATARALTARFPGDPWSWKTLGGLLRVQGNADEALQASRTAVHLAPDDPEAHLELGLAFYRLGQRAEAEASLRRALQLNPRFAEAHSELGRIFEHDDRLAEAETSYRRALALQPDSPAALAHLADALKFQVKFDEAEAALRRAIAVQPDRSGSYVDLSLVLRFQSRLDEAEAALRQAIALQPDNAAALTSLAYILRDTYRLAEAEQTLRQAIERHPSMTEARSNLLFSHNYNAEHTPEYCLEEARRYGEVVRGKATAPYSSWKCEADPQRLRIGFISGDIYSHPVGFFLESVLGQFDQNQVELIGYPTNPRFDNLTQRLQPHFASWRPLDGLSDEAAARQIHGDGIHVLVELSGHTINNRLPVLAWKPAPVQVSWLGYFATTGVSEIDYFLADEVSVPAGHRSHFTETVWNLPDTRLCFTPPEIDLPVSPLPALATGTITFGCFQSYAKLSDRTLALWARVLQRVPNARLRFQTARLASEEVRAQLAERLRAAGIAAERVEMHGPAPRPLYLAAYAEVDLILDTLPFPGGTTTCEALWMGVPTLTIAGDRLLSRQGASLMRAAGLPEWVAEDEDAFVARAADLCREPARLGELRAGLRARLLRAPLFDAARFAANLETALWQMWRKRQQGG